MTSPWSAAEREIWRPKDEGNVWQWADANIHLPPDSAEPGMYRSGRVPYMRAPQEAFTDEEVEVIVLMCAAQVTKSTTMMNMLGYAIDQDPGPVGWLVPTEDAIFEPSQHKCRNMVLESPAIRRHWSGSPRDLALKRHVFDTLIVEFMWAGSPTVLAQTSRRYLFIDEPDKFPGFAGRESNPIDLAIHRITTYWDTKVVIACTPTTPEGYTAQWYADSNKGKFYCPCPNCGEFQVWKFMQLKCPQTLRDPDEIIKSGDVWYECEFCRFKIREEAKGDLVAAGKWLVEGQTITVDGNIEGQPSRSKMISGFQISALVSPFAKVTWPRILARWFKANTPEGIARGGLMDFHNSTLGEPFVEQGKQLKARDLHRLVGGFSKGTVPDGCLMLVAGADYHETRERAIVRIDWEVRGFGYDCKNWVIASGWSSSFSEMEKEILLSPFPWSDATPNEAKPFLAVTCVFIDSGFMPDKVYEYCRRRPGLCFPVKGEAGPRRTPLQFTDLEAATLRRLTPKQRKRWADMQLGIVDTSFFKDQVTQWASDTLDEEGNITTPALTNYYAEMPSLYFTEFTNEKKVLIRDRAGNAKYLWQPVSPGAQTHCLDTAVYAAAAGFYKRAFYLRDPKRKELPAAGVRRRIFKRRIGHVQRN